jgi:hypothetical protein
MGFRLWARRSDRIRFVSSIDAAVQMDTAERKAAYARYLDDLDEGHLTLTGKPNRLILRPLTQDVYEVALGNVGATRRESAALGVVLARELVRLCLEDLEEWPADWGEKRTAYRYEGDALVLIHELAATLPLGLVVEAAKVLQDGLLALAPKAPELKEGETPPFPAGSAAPSGS